MIRFGQEINCQVPLPPGTVRALSPSGKFGYYNVWWLLLRRRLKKETWVAETNASASLSNENLVTGR